MMQSNKKLTWFRFPIPKSFTQNANPYVCIIH